jgi:demethylmenaquinone methyltransferase/2-methoxy-6-polyprenyl-1,4-benzoquinol methylase
MPGRAVAGKSPADEIRIVPTVPLDKREVRIRRMFGTIAPWYDFLNHFLSLNIDKRWRSIVARRVPPVGTEPILDLCTGTGDLALAYHRVGTGRVPIIAADFCHEMLVRAQAKFASAGGQIRIVEADAQHLPFPDAYFQLVTNSFGLRNITDTDRGLAEMVRVTRPGGRVAILEFSKPRNRFLRWLYFGYFRSILPRIGKAFCRNEDDAYRYLPESVLQFPDGEAMLAKLRAHGLIEAEAHPLTFGIATLYVGRKPA